MESQQNSLDTFRVREGAVVDLGFTSHLESTSSSTDQLPLFHLPGSSALILHGLEPEGQRPNQWTSG